MHRYTLINKTEFFYLMTSNKIMTDFKICPKIKLIQLLTANFLYFCYLPRNKCIIAETSFISRFWKIGYTESIRHTG